MSRKTITIRKPREPKLRVHKQSGRFYATFSNPSNVDPDTGSIESWKVWFGDHERTAKRRFRTYLAEWDANDYARPDAPAARPPVGGASKAAAASDDTEPTVRELVDRFRVHTKRRKREGWFDDNGFRFELAIGTTTGPGAVGDSPLLADHGHRTVGSMTVADLTALQESMATAGNIGRSEVNARFDWVVKLFEFAVLQGLMDPAEAIKLGAVKRVRGGELDTREGEKTPAVEDWVVEATLPHLAPHHRTVVRLLRLTGMRPAELFKLTPAMIDRSGEVWFADDPELASGKRLVANRFISFGPDSRKLLRPLLLKVPSDRPLFRDVAVKPRSATQALGKELRRAVVRANRQRAAEGLSRLARRKGDAVARGLLLERFGIAHFAQWTQDGLQRTRKGTFAELVTKLGEKRLPALIEELGGEAVPNWTLYQLRSAKLSEVRAKHGIEGAAAIGWHSLPGASITEGYSRAAKAELAVEIARDAG